MSEIAPAVRRVLPNRRHLWTQKASVGGQTVHIGFGEYEDTSLGEVWIDCSKAGSMVKDLLHSVAIFISTSLQYGMPIQGIIENLQALSFPPQGQVTGECLEDIDKAQSVLDLVGQIIQKEYPGGLRRVEIQEAKAAGVDTSQFSGF